MDITCITVDCADPERVATFWNDALRWGGVAVAADGSGAICGPPSGGWYLECIRVPEDKVVKNRVHLGCSAGRLEELDAELSRLQELGATIAWEEEFPPAVASQYRNVILRDVEGNEFCLGGGSFPRRSRRDRPRLRRSRGVRVSRRGRGRCSGCGGTGCPGPTPA